MSPEERVKLGARIRALYEHLQMTQDMVAARSGALLTREYMNKIVNGSYALSSGRQQDGLAAGFGLSRDDLVAYAKGEIEMDEAVRRRKVDASSMPQRDAAATVAVNSFSATADDVERVNAEHPDLADLGAEWLQLYIAAATSRIKGEMPERVAKYEKESEKRKRRSTMAYGGETASLEAAKERPRKPTEQTRVEERDAAGKRFAAEHYEETKKVLAAQAEASKKPKGKRKNGA